MYNTYTDNSVIQIIQVKKAKISYIHTYILLVGGCFVLIIHMYMHRSNRDLYPE